MYIYIYVCVCAVSLSNHLRAVANASASEQMRGELHKSEILLRNSRQPLSSF